MANRRELIAKLIEDHGYDATALLDSLVAAMSEKEFKENMEYVLRVGDYHHRIASNGELILAELTGKFETGASNHATNSFILESINDPTINNEIKNGTTAADIRSSCSGLFHPDTDLHDVNLIEAETYFNDCR